MKKTTAKFAGKSGKKLLALIPANGVGRFTHNGIGYLLTPRVYESSNRLAICANEDADVVELESQHGDYYLVRI